MSAVSVHPTPSPTLPGWPIPATSGQRQRLRLNRGDTREINRAIRSIATIQAAHHALAQACLIRKQAEQKTRREAIRALKRQLVRTVFRRPRESAEGLQMAD